VRVQREVYPRRAANEFPVPRGLVTCRNHRTRAQGEASDWINLMIYLPEGWTGNTPAELSILVHEMVHHLQNVENLKFECPQEREQLAYKAQERWLGLFGRDLLRDFELDPFTLLVATRCGY
jgi:hypothetical protein